MTTGAAHPPPPAGRRPSPQSRSSLWPLLLATGLACLLAGLTPMPATPGLGSPSGPRLVATRPGSSSWPASFWFGRASELDNYVDVRVHYDDQALYLWANVVDYYLWWDASAQGDPRDFDSIAFYLDTAGSQANAPMPTSLFFVSGYHWWPSGNDVRWHRQGRGTGASWDESWQPTQPWTDDTGARWYVSGPNDNSDRDAGWLTTVTIPWETLGRSTPPPAGTSWRLGAKLYDRDDRPPAIPDGSQVWPTGFLSSSPASWGSLVFDPPAYQPRTATNQQSLVIRRESASSDAVADAWAGGGGLCGGGYFGGGDVPHPGSTTDPNLFGQNQADVADFPCFSKSFLRFRLAGIPPGKTVVQATLQLFHFGNSNPAEAKPTFVQVFSILDPWDEATITWNNAPQATENLGGTWVNPIPAGGSGTFVIWDVTSLVARAYAAGESASLALYSADLDMHSGKYFRSSEIGDAAVRPTLTVIWGDSEPSQHSVLLPRVVR